MNQALILPDPNNKPQVQHYYVQTVAAWLQQYQTNGEAAVSNLMGALAAKHMVGVGCLLLKSQCNHGEFLKLRAEHFPDLKERTCAEWQSRAEKDMAASLALREATNRLLTAPGEEAALRGFAEVANEYFRTKTTLLKQGAGEIGLLGWRKEREPAGGNRPAKKLTPDEQVRQRQKAARENWLHIETTLKGFGIAFALLEDVEVQSQIALLEKQVQAMKRWVNTPVKQRDARRLEKLLKD